MSNAISGAPFPQCEKASREMSIFIPSLEPLQGLKQLQQMKLPSEKTSTVDHPDGMQTHSQNCVVKTNESLLSEYDSMTEISKNEYSDLEGRLPTLPALKVAET